MDCPEARLHESSAEVSANASHCPIILDNLSGKTCLDSAIKRGNSIDIAAQTKANTMLTNADISQHIDNLFRDVQSRKFVTNETLTGTIALVSDVFSYAETLRAELDAVKAVLQALRAPVAIDGADEAVAVLPNDGADEAITPTAQ